MRNVVLSLCIITTVLLSASQASQSQNSSAGNSDPVYQQLRNISLGSEAITIKDVDLKRDGATFHLRSGTVCFVTPVQGKVTGAVFVGEGNLGLRPPIPIEDKMLKLLTREDEFSENFSQMVFRFTDATYEDIKKAGGTPGGTCNAALLKDSQAVLRLLFKYNIDGRILQDVLGSETGGLFVALINGKRYSDKEVFAIDPHGAPSLQSWVAPEEVEFVTFDDNKRGVWAAFHLSNEYASGRASGSEENGVIHIEHQKLDATIEKNANLIGKATTTFVSKVNGLRVVPFDLYRTLRVQSVTTDGGQALSFIQEDKDADSDFFVILPKPLASGEKFTVTTSYSGKEAVSSEGGGNYFPIARDNWYPNNGTFSLGAYATYDMTFHIPKGMKIAATGSLVSENNEGSESVTVWKSDAPQTVAGFNFGRFRMQEAKLQKPDYLVQSYANEEPPDMIKRILKSVSNDLPGEDNLSGVALGTMSTVPMMKKALAEGQLALQLYTDYFGPVPYKRLAMTQQTACNFGQAWPGLVWLPICSFYDATVRHEFGLDNGDRGYWKIVAPHEVAHQWWGHHVGFGSYRDQWMSEGFAEMSASLFIQMIEKNPKKFIDFWNDERLSLLEKNSLGIRAIDAGPVTLGYRLSNTKTGTNITRDLIYPKGGYILHMIRMMMSSTATGDQNFKDLMHDFTQSFANRAATTEDFKAVLERHMNGDMVATAGGRNSMDWFFNEYVYGTALPSYKFDYSFDTNAQGQIVVNLTLSQSGVDDTFRMPVPIYFELADGRVVLFARVVIGGNKTVSQQIPIPRLTEKPKRALINYLNDVLSTPN